jgi:hypothetical protein
MTVRFTSVGATSRSAGFAMEILSVRTGTVRNLRKLRTVAGLDPSWTWGPPEGREAAGEAGATPPAPVAGRRGSPG